MTRSLAAVSSFSSDRDYLLSFSELSTSPSVSFSRLHPTPINWGSTLHRKASLSFTHLCSTYLLFFAIKKNRLFVFLFFLPPEIFSLSGTLTVITLCGLKVLQTRVRRKYLICSSPLSFFSLTIPTTQLPHRSSGTGSSPDIFAPSSLDFSRGCRQPLLFYSYQP